MTTAGGYRITGLMSGSSLDGVDLACCEFFLESGKWQYLILEAETIPYPSALKEELEQATTWEMKRIRRLDATLGIYYARLINEFHHRHGLHPDLIASHGHTVLHRPDKGVTFQAGEGGTMANRTGITVINDFRSEDVAQGGQGAPLVPVGDRLLFGDFDACLNLGGFANISYESETKVRMAFDVGPVNLALNWIAGLAGKSFDKDGRIAGRGRVHKELLSRINALDFFRLPPPKSLGREWFREAFLPLLSESSLAVPDLMATATEHIAIQLSKAVKGSGASNVLVTGGGALNKTLVKRFRYHTGARIRIPEPRLVRFKEAMVFAFLGLLKSLGEVNCLASVTGGINDLSTGTVHYP